MVKSEGTGGADTIRDGLSGETVHVLESDGAEHLLDLALGGTVVAADKGVEGGEDGSCWGLLAVEGSEGRSDGEGRGGLDGLGGGSCGGDDGGGGDALDRRGHATNVPLCDIGNHFICIYVCIKRREDEE